MIVSLSDTLEWAERRHVAVAAVNTPFFEALLATIDVGEELGVPIILQFAQVHEPLVSIKEIGPAMVELAARSTSPFVLHVDHGEDLDYITTGLDIGFNSAMLDGSHLPFDENIALTRGAVELCAERGVGVEGEIGVMTGNENGDPSQGVADESLYTDPAVAAEFVRETGVACLAASFGTVHGVYHREPRLNLALLDRLSASSGVPIVMHGGSGLSSTEYRDSIAHGVRKINYYTYAAKAAYDAVIPLVEDPNVMLFPPLAKAARGAVQRDVLDFVRIVSGL